MLLLYCDINSATVIAMHDDKQPPVPSSSYGSPGGTRIIPWAGSVADLTKVGTAPPPMPDGSRQIDSRPYAQPTETKALLLAYAAQKRYERSVKGISYTTLDNKYTIQLETGRDNASLINNLATHATSLNPTDPISFTQANVLYPITAQDAINMFNAVLAAVQDYRNIEATCITDLNSTTPTIKTYFDVDAKFA